MRQNYSFSKNSNVLLEPCEGRCGGKIGLIGGVRCMAKFSSATPTPAKTAACGSARIFLIVAATILRSFFL